MDPEIAAESVAEQDYRWINGVFNGQICSVMEDYASKAIVHREKRLRS